MSLSPIRVILVEIPFTAVERSDTCYAHTFCWLLGGSGTRSCSKTFSIVNCSGRLTRTSPWIFASASRIAHTQSSLTFTIYNSHGNSQFRNLNKRTADFSMDTSRLATKGRMPLSATVPCSNAFSSSGNGSSFTEIGSPLAIVHSASHAPKVRSCSRSLLSSSIARRRR